VSAPIILYINTTGRTLVANFLSSVQALSALIFEAGDNVPLQLHFLQANTQSSAAGSLPYTYIDPATVTPVSLALGEIGLQPTGGTFTVSFNTATTAALAYNISAANLQTAINGLSGIPAGGVTVVGPAGGPWTVTFTATGAPGYELVINPGELVPASVGLTAIAIAGATGVQEQEVLTLLQSPAALQTSWTATYGSAVVARVQAGGSGLNEIQTVTIPTSSYGGTFSLSFGGQGTSALAYNSTAAQVQAALQGLSSIGSGNCSVIQTSNWTWTVTFTGSLANAGQSLIVASGTGLQSPMYLAGSLNLNVQGVFNLLVGVASASVTLQIQQGTSGSINTVVQTTATLNATLIQGTPSVPNSANPWQTLTEVEALIANAYTSVRNASAFAVTSNATLANVTGLSVNLAASTVYSFEAWLLTTATSGGGVQAAIGGTATATSIEYEGIMTSAAALVDQNRASALATAVCSSATTTGGTIRITGTIVVNAAGTLTVQFAQNTSNAGASTVLAGSWFRVWTESN
jgi:hypothetical protein